MLPENVRNSTTLVLSTLGLMRRISIQLNSRSTAALLPHVCWHLKWPTYIWHNFCLFISHIHWLQPYPRIPTTYLWSLSPNLWHISAATLHISTDPCQISVHTFNIFTIVCQISLVISHASIYTCPILTNTWHTSANIWHIYIDLCHIPADAFHIATATCHIPTAIWHIFTDTFYISSKLNAYPLISYTHSLLSATGIRPISHRPSIFRGIV